MKKSLIKLLPLTAAAVLVMVFIAACSVDDLTKDVNIYTSSDFLVSPLAVQITDGADDQTIPSDIAITFEGKDKDKLYTLFGEKNIKAVGGIVSLAVKKIDEPTAAKPLEFTMSITATNCMPIRKSFKLTSVQEESLDKIHMVNTAKTATGISVSATSFTSAAATGTAAVVNIASPLSNGKTEQMKAVVGVGTKLLAADGSELSGTVQSQVVHFDTKSEASLRSAPMDFGNLTIKMATGATEQSSFFPAAIYTLDMTAGGKEVKSFSKPLDVTVDIDPNTFYAEQNRKIQAGDVLDIMSRNNGEETWAVEGVATVVNNGGKLQVTYKQAHLSGWAVGWRAIFKCALGQGTAGGNVTLSSDVPASLNTDCGVALDNYSWGIVNANNPFLAYKNGTGSLKTGANLGALSLANSISVKFIVISKAGQVVYTSPAQKLCANSTIDLKGKLPANNSTAGKFNVSAKCQSGGVTTTYIPTGLQVYYRDMANANTNAWSPLVYVKNGAGCIKGLKVGRKYDFMIPVSNSKGKYVTLTEDFLQPNGIEIPTGDLTISVNSPVWGYTNTLTIKKQPNGTYEFNQPIDLPAKVCTEFQKYMSFIIKK